MYLKLIFSTSPFIWNQNYLWKLTSPLYWTVAAIIYSLNCEPFCTPFPLPLLPSLLIIQSAGILDGERESAIMAKTILIWVPCMRTFNFSACMPTTLLYLSGSWTHDKEIR